MHGILNQQKNLIRSPRECIVKNQPQKYMHLCTLAWCDSPSTGPKILVALTTLDQRLHIIPGLWIFKYVYYLPFSSMDSYFVSHVGNMDTL